MVSAIAAAARRRDGDEATLYPRTRARRSRPGLVCGVSITHRMRASSR
ncbi:hypothetical protein [Lysobacter gummosus]